MRRRPTQSVTRAGAGPGTDRRGALRKGTLMQTFTLRKPEVRSPHGLVAAQNRYAAEAGAAVLGERRQCHGCRRRDGSRLERRGALALGHRRWRVSPPRRRGDGHRSYARLQRDAPAGPRSCETIRLREPRLGNWFDWPSVEGDRNIVGLRRRSASPARSPGLRKRCHGSGRSPGATRFNRRSSMQSAGWRSTGSRPFHSRSKPRPWRSIRRLRRSSSTMAGPPGPANARPCITTDAATRQNSSSDLLRRARATSTRAKPRT